LWRAERELARLDISSTGPLASQGRAGLIAGEAGAGKTALLDEWARGPPMRMAI